MAETLREVRTREVLARRSAGDRETGLLSLLEIVNQQRLEQLEQFADIFACMFDDLPAEYQANWMLAAVEQEAA